MCKVQTDKVLCEEIMTNDDNLECTPVERMEHRIKQECRLLHLTANHLENPREWKESV